MRYREATTSDLAALATMNFHLIRDEGHRNPMSVDELQARMAGWLAGEYRAVLFEDESGLAGYALFREDEDSVYLRQFFVTADRRCAGIGHAAMNWLVDNVWSHERRVRLDVLVGNQRAIRFWRSAGFADYCITMERTLAG